MATAKTALRQTMLGVRDAIAPKVAARAAVEVAQRALATALSDDLAIIAVYAAVRSELDTTPLIKELLARDVALAFPRVLSDRQRLAFHRVNRPTELSPGYAGILEPARSAPLVPIKHIDLFIIPGIAFDSRGNRLGWGRGHYDATLAENPHAVRVGYSFECQVVDVVPSSSNDLSMDLVITEARVLHTGRGSGEVPR